MNPIALGRYLLGCPGPRAWLEGLAGKLLTGECVVAYMPWWIDRSAVRQRLTELVNRARVVVDVDLEMFEGGQSPKEVFSRLSAHGASLLDTLNSESVNAVVDPPFEVLLIDGIGKLSTADVGLWNSLLMKWTATLKGRDPHDRWPAYAVLVDSGCDGHLLPAADVHVNHEFWGACCSLLEFRLAYRSILGLSPAAPEAAFLEHVIASLCNVDADSALAVTPTILDSDREALVEAVSAHLLSAATRRNIGLDRATQAVEADRVSPGTGADDRKLTGQLLVLGLISDVPEHGIEVSPMALGLIDGRSWEIAHRIWRGQVALTLPLIDEIRHYLNSSLVKHFGNAWPSRWASLGNRSLREDEQYGAELGLIVRCLDQSSDFRRFRGLLELARQAHFLRNRLAHYQVISYEDYRALRFSFSGVRR